MSKFNNSVASQRTRLLKRLMKGDLVSTFKAREEEDISHPAGRVLELRQEGYNIQTVKIREQSTCGDFHIIAQYVLLPGLYQEQEHGL